jgi:hypothetical protein
MASDARNSDIQQGGHEMTSPRVEGVKWKTETVLEKYESEEDFKAGRCAEVIKDKDNLAVQGGWSNLWQCLIGNGTGTGGQNLTFFNNANAHIGVGDSSTAAVASQTDLQASTNKVRVAMDATYPQHTDGVNAGALSIVFRMTAGSGVANFAWNEWGVFNASSSGRMLNRKVFTGGTKASGAVWVFTVTLTGS